MLSRTKLNKELRVWVDTIQREEQDFLVKAPKALQELEKTPFLPVRSESTQIVDSSVINESLLQQQESIQAVHSDMASAKKLRDYYSKWDKYNTTEQTEEGKTEKNNPKVSSTTSQSNEKLHSSSNKNTQSALDEKEKGNNHFKKGNWKEAISCYTTAMMLDPMNDVYPLNRAMAYIKLEDWENVLDDSNRALMLNSLSVKGFFRKATALFHLGEYDVALNNIKESLKLDPKNGPAKALQKKILAAKNKPKPEMIKEVSSSKKELTPNDDKQIKEKKIEPTIIKPIEEVKETKIPSVKEEKKISPIIEVLSTTKEEKTEKVSEKVNKDSDANPLLVPVVPSTIPSTSFEFERKFVDLKKFPDLLYQYLQVRIL